MIIIMKKEKPVRAIKAQRQHKKVVIAKSRPDASPTPKDEKSTSVFGRMKGTARILGDIFSTGESWEADS